MDFSLNSNIPLAQKLGPEPAEQMQQVMSLGTMANQQQMQRMQIQQQQVSAQHQQLLRDVFTKNTNPQTGEIDFDRIRPQLYAVDPTYGKEFDQAQGMVAYHNMMAKASAERSDAAQKNADSKQQALQDQLDKMTKAQTEMRLNNLSNGLYKVDNFQDFQKMYPHLIDQGYKPEELADPTKPDAFPDWKAALTAAHPPMGMMGMAIKQQQANTAAARAPSQGGHFMATVSRPITLPDGSINKNPTQADIDAAGVLEGRLPPDLSFINKRGKDAQPRTDAVNSALYRLDPTFSQVNAQGDNKYWNSSKTKMQRQAIDAFQGIIPHILQASSELERTTGAPLIDGKLIDARAAMGDANATNLKSWLTLGQEDFGKAVAGSGNMTNEQLSFAERMLKSGFNHEQLQTILTNAQSAANARKVEIFRQGGIYGRYAARTDPYLSPEQKQEIISGGAQPGAAPAASGSKVDLSKFWK